MSGASRKLSGLQYGIRCLSPTDLTVPWKEMKAAHPFLFQNTFKDGQDKQEMICTISLKDVVAPFAARVQLSIRAGNTQRDAKTWYTADLFKDTDLVMRDDVKDVDWECVLVTEASSHLGEDSSPELLHKVYRHYPATLLCCGFNMLEQKTGSKDLLG